MNRTDEPDRLHVALRVRDLSRSIAFYRDLLDRAPVKTRDDYAKFELETPPLVLSLLPGAPPEGPGSLAHLGIRLASQADLERERARLAGLGRVSLDEGETSCCYARQDKLWVTDPDGNAWELYRLLGDVEDGDPAAREACPETTACCE